MWQNNFWRLAACALACGLSLPAAAKDKPEAILLAARKSTDAQAWSVEARVNTEKNMKITGIMFGKDFDLTIETVDGLTRLITLGDKNWSSEDGGKTWKTVEVADRRFYYLVHTPVKSTVDGKIPPFEVVGTEKLGGESLLHIRFIAPEKVQYEGDRPNYWIAVEGKQSPVIHRYYGQAAFDNNYVDDKVDYKLVTEKNPILPPPGNPLAAAPAAGPERLLMAAMKKMSSGVWEVKGIATLKKTIQLHGLLEGENFDLTMEPGAQLDIPMREIMIGDKAWICSDGKTWHSGIAQDRLVYNLTHTPILYGRLEPPFQKMESEERDGATWLHIRLQVPEAKVDPKDVPNYWLVLDAQGEALYIGRAELPMISPGNHGGESLRVRLRARQRQNRAAAGIGDEARHARSSRFTRHDEGGSFHGATGRSRARVRRNRDAQVRLGGQDHPRRSHAQAPPDAGSTERLVSRDAQGLHTIGD